jgi:hypothetical protein
MTFIKRGVWEAGRASEAVNKLIGTNEEENGLTVWRADTRATPDSQVEGVAQCVVVVSGQ